MLKSNSEFGIRNFRPPTLPSLFKMSSRARRLKGADEGSIRLDSLAQDKPGWGLMGPHARQRQLSDSEAVSAIRGRKQGQRSGTGFRGGAAISSGSFMPRPCRRRLLPLSTAADSCRCPGRWFLSLSRPPTAAPDFCRCPLPLSTAADRTPALDSQKSQRLLMSRSRFIMSGKDLQPS